MGDKIPSSVKQHLNCVREHHTVPSHINPSKELAMKHVEDNKKTICKTYDDHERHNQPKSICLAKAIEKAINIYRTGLHGCHDKCTRCMDQEYIAKMVK